MHIYDFHISTVGLLAQLVERCTGIACAKVMVQIPFGPERNFFFLTTSSVVFIAARIAYIRLFTAVHIYDFHMFTIIIHHLYTHLKV